MDKRSAVAALGRFRGALETRGVSVERLVLFGSYAAGTQRDGSDIDVVVVSDDFRGKDHWQRIEILSDAIYEVFQPIEAVGVTKEEWEKGGSSVVDFAREGEVVAVP